MRCLTRDFWIKERSPRAKFAFFLAGIVVTFAVVAPFMPAEMRSDLLKVATGSVGGAWVMTRLVERG